LKAVHWSTGLGTDWPWRVLLLPVGGLLTGWIVHRFAPEAGGHGTEAVIRSIHERFGKIRATVVPVKLLATVITLGVGGSAGKEGPAAQIGSGIASLISDALHLTNADRRKLAVCGISAGFAGVFGLPIAGSIFGIEVLAVGSMFYEYLLPSFLAGITAFQVVRALGVSFDTYNLGALPQLSEPMLLQVLLIGSILGLVALFFIEMMNAGHHLFHRIRVPEPWRPFIGGVLLVIMAYTVSKQYLGLSLDLLHAALGGAQIAAAAFLWKVFFTSVTLGSGFSGGVITPLFVIGATAGSVLGGLFGFAPQVGAAMGMIGLIAGAANTPIAATIMGIEMFGPGFSVFAAAVSITSFLLAGHRSIYSSQILCTRKAANLQIETNVSIQDLHATVRLSAYRPVVRVLRWLRRASIHQPSRTH
jgi:H+/Cl- antiporter ClcA